MSSDADRDSWQDERGISVASPWHLLTYSSVHMGRPAKRVGIRQGPWTPEGGVLYAPC